MELKEKVAYLKGLMEGMEYDVSTKEGKLMAAVVETLDAMAARVEEIDTDVDQLFDEVDAVSEDLEDVEDYLFDGEDGDEEDYADEYEAGLYEITCPNCGEVVCVDEDMLASDDLTCPNCGTKFEVDFSEDEPEGEETAETEEKEYAASLLAFAQRAKNGRPCLAGPPVLFSAARRAAVQNRRPGRRLPSGRV